MRFSIIKKNKAFQELHEGGRQEVVACGVHAVGMAPTERFKLRRQMAAAAGKKEHYFVSFVSWRHMALKLKKSFLPWPLNIGQKEVCTGKWNYEQKEAWMRQIREVQTWKQVKGDQQDQ